MSTMTLASPPLLHCLQELEQGGHHLRQALLKRNADAIWTALARQEQSLVQLQRYCPPEILEDDPPNQIFSKLDASIKELILRIRNAARINKKLARVFLTMIDRTLAGFSSGELRGHTVYNESGKIGHSPTPVFVQEKG